MNTMPEFSFFMLPLAESTLAPPRSSTEAAAFARRMNEHARQDRARAEREREARLAELTHLERDAKSGPASSSRGLDANSIYAARAKRSRP